MEDYMKKILSVLLVVVVVGTAVYLKFDKQPQTDNTPPVYETDFITSVDFMALGDLLYHSPFLEDPSKSAFSLGFKHFESMFSSYDYVLANYETTTNPSRAYSGYPMFNTPPAAIDAIYEAGINILNTNNNHTLDTGLTGVISTLEHIRERGIKTVGTTLPDEPKRLDLRKEGIKIGVISFSYGYNGLEQGWSQEYMDTYLAKIDESKIQRAIDSSIEAGNDFTIAIMHWGNEYQINASSFQKELAKKMAQWGVDVIVGAHPHVVQETEIIGDTFVIYSLGNFVSNQRVEYLNTLETERGAVVGFTLEKNFSKNETSIKGLTFEPIWVYKYIKNGSSYYEVIPTSAYLKGEIDVSLSQEYQKRIKDTDEIVRNRLLSGIQ